MTPREELGLLSTLRVLAMGEFCGDIVPAEIASASVVDVEGIAADDPEWPNPINSMSKIGRKRGRPRTREPVIGPKRPRGRPRLADNMLRKRRGKLYISMFPKAHNIFYFCGINCREQEANGGGEVFGYPVHGPVQGQGQDGREMEGEQRGRGRNPSKCGR